MTEPEAAPAQPVAQPLPGIPPLPANATIEDLINHRRSLQSLVYLMLERHVEPSQIRLRRSFEAAARLKSLHNPLRIRVRCGDLEAEYLGNGDGIKAAQDLVNAEVADAARADAIAREKHRRYAHALLEVEQRLRALDGPAPAASNLPAPRDAGPA